MQFLKKIHSARHLLVYSTEICYPKSNFKIFQVKKHGSTHACLKKLQR